LSNVKHSSQTLSNGAVSVNVKRLNV